MKDRRGAYRVLAWRPQGKRPGRRPWRRWRIILKWIFKKGMDWIDLAQDRDRWLALVGAVTNLRFP